MADLAGKAVGPYQILEQIGRGGMATVFKAYHPATDRYVAVKILPPELAVDASFRARFEREAKIVASLHHIHIVPVYDYGQDRDVAYLVMPYIPTGTLKSLLEQGPLSLQTALYYFLQIASAVQYAHQRGVLHRDIKPANVLLDDSNNALLNDFGLTRMVEGATKLTGTSVIGTPAYMSPEQGQALAVDARSDIYSLGIVLYEMLTGELPFDADTPIAVIFKHINTPLPLPRSIRPDIPQAVEGVILKCLAKQPADRYQTVNELMAALRHPAAAVPDSDERGTLVDDEADSSTVLLPQKRKRAPTEKRVSWPLIVLVTLIVGGFFLLFALLSSGIDTQDKPTLDPLLATDFGRDMQPIIVALQDLPRGIRIPEDAVTMIYWPRDSIPTYAYRDVDDVIGLTARTYISRGSPILQNHVYWDARVLGMEPTATDVSPFGENPPPGWSPPEIVIPFPTADHVNVSEPGWVEFSLEISPLVKFPDGLAAGDHVDILVTTAPDDLTQAVTSSISWSAVVLRRSDSQIVLLLPSGDSLRLSDSLARSDCVTLIVRAAGDDTIPDDAPDISLDFILQNLETPAAD